MHALFIGGMPGGMELAVIFLMALLLFFIPPLAAVVIYRRVSKSDIADEERIDELEREVAELRRKRNEVGDEQED